MRVPVLSLSRYSTRPSSSGMVLVLTTVPGMAASLWINPRADQLAHVQVHAEAGEGGEASEGGREGGREGGKEGGKFGNGLEVKQYITCKFWL